MATTSTEPRQRAGFDKDYTLTPAVTDLAGFDLLYEMKKMTKSMDHC